MTQDRTTVTDAAASVKARRAGTARKPQAVLGTPGGDPAPDPGRPPGVTGDAPSPAHTLVGSFVAGHITSADYVAARADGYYSWYPRGCRQPSTRLLWSAGQHVLRDYYNSHGGDDAPTTAREALPVNEPGGGITVASVPR